jgi:hypothetical protein
VLEIVASLARRLRRVREVEVDLAVTPRAVGELRGDP